MCERHAVNGGHVYYDQGSKFYIDCPRNNLGLLRVLPEPYAFRFSARKGDYGSARGDEGRLPCQLPCIPAVQMHVV
jgi:hypothetical protein